MTNDERARHRRGDPEAGKQEKCSTIAVTWERSLKTARGGGMVSHHRSRSGLTRTGQSGPGTCTRRVGWPSTGPCRLQPRGPPPSPFQVQVRKNACPRPREWRALLVGAAEMLSTGGPPGDTPTRQQQGERRLGGREHPAPVGTEGRLPAWPSVGHTGAPGPGVPHLVVPVNVHPCVPHPPEVGYFSRKYPM